MVNVSAWIGLLAIVFGPFIAFASFIHLLERIIQRRLAERFGWKSVMWTGWLGTPIHELSHVAMCIAFRHRVDEVALFEPDPASGRLGYVRHSYRKGNWFEELGNVFIGLAPLVGGSLILLVLLKVFYPAAIPAAVPETLEATSAGSVQQSEIWITVSSVFSHVLQLQNFATFKFWIFIYLVLCVGSHMAPSWTDYKGTGRGAIMVAVFMIVAVLVLSLFVSDPGGFQQQVISGLIPLFALFAIAGLLCLIATIVVELLLQFFPKRYEVR